MSDNELILQEIAELKKRVQRQEDIEAIRRLRRQYAERADGGWPEHNGGRTHDSSFADLFTEDGIQDEGKVGPRMVGRETIRELFSSEGMARIPFTMHFMMNDSITINDDGKTGQGEWHVLVTMTAPDGAAMISVGYYHDKYEKDPEKGWLFKEVKIETGRTGFLNSGKPFEWELIDEDVSAR